ncbi:MAG TPA: carboxypeptidase-like regulatory domain-containing protein [Puia sp.]|nr:carboxypeptidase-like regulatory domain-containing protein [Puia sp.]
MKSISLRMAVASVVAAGLLAFSTIRDGSIHGTVSPPEGGIRAWAESASDTVKAPIINGSYDIAGVKPGTYKIVIEAKPPYRNAAREGVMVSDGQASDAGEIRLEK